MLFGVVPLCERLGAGVAEERPTVADPGVLGIVDSETAVGMVNDCLACTAVVRIAFSSSMLFCFLLREPGAIFTFGADDVDCASSPSIGCASPGSPSRPRFLLFSGVAASLTGHTNPVLGVYAGRF